MHARADDMNCARTCTSPSDLIELGSGHNVDLMYVQCNDEDDDDDETAHTTRARMTKL